MISEEQKLSLIPFLSSRGPAAEVDHLESLADFGPLHPLEDNGLTEATKVLRTKKWSTKPSTETR